MKGENKVKGAVTIMWIKLGPYIFGNIILDPETVPSDGDNLAPSVNQIRQRIQKVDPHCMHPEAGSTYNM